MNRRFRTVLPQAASAALMICVLAGTRHAAAQQAPQQELFASAAEAAQALIDAARRGDQARLLALFGPDGRELLLASDPATERRNREVFLAAVAESWRLDDRQPSGKELVVGNENWPFPIPIVQAGGAWRFDTAAGIEEVIARRVGRNELAAIRVCRTYVAAQRIYASRGHDGRPPGPYARRFLSEAGTENGLYWPASAGRSRSPMGEMAARAADEHAGHVAARQQPVPFHGYRFRILEAQGPSASGGAQSYVVDGVLFRGFALIAWPADYDLTGVMTFIVSGDGVVYERDLGPDTATAAGAITVFDPDASWRAVQGDGVSSQ